MVVVSYGGCLSAQTVHGVRDSVRIYFRQGKIDLVPELRDNRKALDRIAGRLKNTYTDSIYRLQRIEVVGGASPEGSVSFNRWLSERRAGVLFDYLSRYGTLPDTLKTSTFLGRDWDGLIRMVKDDPDVPYREETLALLREIADEARGSVPTRGDHLGRVQRLRGGVPYRYMYKHHFPELRASRLYLEYEKVWNPAKPAPVVVLKPDTVYIHDTLYVVQCPPCKPFYMAIKTNALYDVLAVPNIGVEFYLGKGWSAGADWMYGWWKCDHRHRYWRAYGGDVYLRKWLGRAARRKPLTGHHLGVYGQLLTYDFEWGGKGIMGGEPGGSLWDRAHWGAGLEYGYSVPIARRWNLDFTLGAGYLEGKYYEYRPVDGCYVWQATKNRRWIGPTKAEISFVWLIGCDNYNRKKGGKR